MTTVFQTKPLLAQSLMQRLLKQLPADNAIIEVNNLLASRPIRSITTQELDDIESRYGFRLDRYQLNLEEFYAVHLNFRLTDHELTHEEQAELTHLRELFRLSAPFIEMVHSRIGEAVYRSRVEQAIQHATLSADEKASLRSLQHTLSLSATLADNIYREACQAQLAKRVEEASSDARLSPDDVLRLEQISHQFGIEPAHETQQVIERYRRYWLLEQADLPMLTVSIALQRGEVCHFQMTAVSWYEERASARRTSYDDHFEYSQVFDVVNLHSSRAVQQKERFDLLKRMGTGTVYLTNKRLLLEGSDKTTAIKLPAILDARAYRQGLFIDKATGKDIVLLMKHDGDGLTLILQRLLHQSRSIEK